MRSFRLVVSHLQYANDTLPVADSTIENLWSIREIFRSFELASRIRVSFFKSLLIWINVDSSFLSSACYLIHCGLSSLPFKYFGLIVGPILASNVRGIL